MNRSGSLLAGRYRLTARLATGGMGEIWAATDELLDRQVAAKLVKPEYAGDPVFRQRLHAEAKAAAAVRNPHVVDVFDVGEDTTADGEPVSFVIMELVAGASMATVMAAGPLTAAETADLLSQVGDALATAHDCGVVHRDIKPANLIRDAAGHITVLDFGIARAADASALTATGMMLGTARYISPEQVDARPATAASDVYSLGVVAYHCLAGHPPFDVGSDIATALAHRDQPPPPLPPTVPAELAALVERCLAKAPAERPTAREVAQTAAVLDVAPVPAAPTVVAPAPVGAAPTPGLTTLAVAPVNPPTAAAAASGLPEWLEWRRIGAVAAAGVVVLGVLTVIGIASNGSGPASASSGSHSAAQVQPVGDSATQKIRVHSGRYVGEPYATARRQLRRLGLKVRESGATSAPSARVTAVAPVGRVPVGQFVTLTVLPGVSGPVHHTPHHAAAPTPTKPKPKAPKPPKAPKESKPTPPGHAKGGEPGHGHGAEK